MGPSSVSSSGGHSRCGVRSGARAKEETYSGLMARSARSRILRAIPVSSPGASTSLDASSQTARCADLISLAMMSMASSLGVGFAETAS